MLYRNEFWLSKVVIDTLSNNYNNERFLIDVNRDKSRSVFYMLQLFTKKENTLDIRLFASLSLSLLHSDNTSNDIYRPQVRYPLAEAEHSKNCFGLVQNKKGSLADK